MSKIIHMGISVRGLLGKSEAQLKKIMRACSKDDGSDYLNVFEFRNDLCDLIADGKEVIPMGCCDNWDYKEGCQGHEEQK